MVIIMIIMVLNDIIMVCWCHLIIIIIIMILTNGNYYIYIWVNYNDLTATSLESWLDCGKSSPNGRKILVSEIL